MGRTVTQKAQRVPSSDYMFVALFPGVSQVCPYSFWMPVSNIDGVAQPGVPANLQLSLNLVLSPSLLLGL